MHTHIHTQSNARMHTCIQCINALIYSSHCSRKKSWVTIPWGCAIAQAVSGWPPTAAVRGSKPDLVLWDLWWDKVALGQVFSEYFSFPCNHRSLHQLLQNHPHVSSRECTIGQCGCSAGTYRDLGDLKTRDLRNLNLGDLKKGPKGA
jgi:hypothetical protein